MRYRRLVDADPPKDDELCIDEYFELVDDESYTVSSSTLDVPVKELTDMIRRLTETLLREHARRRCSCEGLCEPNRLADEAHALVDKLEKADVE